VDRVDRARGVYLDDRWCAPPSPRSRCETPLIRADGCPSIENNASNPLAQCCTVGVKREYVCTSSSTVASYAHTVTMGNESTVPTFPSLLSIIITNCCEGSINSGSQNSGRTGHNTKNLSLAIIVECKQSTGSLIMAPTTRSTRFQTPPPEPLAGKEATTTRKCKFFDVLARDGSTKSLRHISKDCGIDEKTGRRWRDQHMNMGNLARRSTRQSTWA
jgi:hypothetical protein